MSKLSDIGRHLAHRHKMAVDEVLLTVDGKNYFDLEVAYDQVRKCVVLKPKKAPENACFLLISLL